MTTVMTVLKLQLQNSWPETFDHFFFIFTLHKRDLQYILLDMVCISPELLLLTKKNSSVNLCRSIVHFSK